MPPKKRAGGRSRPDPSVEEQESKRAKTRAPNQGRPTSPFAPYPPSKVYRLVEPGPVLLVSTGPALGSEGSGPDPRDVNLMTMGFHMMLQHDSPPLIAVCIGPWDATYARLRATEECVLAVPGAEMARTVVDIGNCSADDLAGYGGGAAGTGVADEDVDDDEEEEDDDDDDDDGAPPAAANKFEKFGLAALPAGKVGAPLVGGEHIMANVECVVHDDAMVDRYNLWVLRVVAAWVNERKRPGEAGRMFHHRGDGTFSVDGEEVLDLRERMVKWKMFQD